MLQGIVAWKARIAWLWRVFSIEPLFETLLSPWHRERTQKNEGFAWWERVLFNTFVRIIGMIFRLAIIIPGLVLILLIILAFPVYATGLIKLDQQKLRRTGSLGRDLAFGFTPHLKTHAREMGHRGSIKLVGKQEAYDNMERVLAKASHNNVMLIGESGSGRTTLIESLAGNLSIGNSKYDDLQYRHVWHLETEGLDSNQFQDIIIEAANAGNIILVIDNFHAYPDLPDLLLPYLSISSLQIVAVTDRANFHSRIKDRTDIMSAFVKVEIEPINDEELSAFITELITGSGYLVSNDRFVGELIRLTNRLDPYQAQPQKSLELLEEIVLQSGENNTLDIETLYQIEQAKTGVKVGEIDTAEKDTLLNLESKMAGYVIGQDQALHVVADALRRSRSGLQSDNKPVGSFLFVGPTGTGKTYTSKILSKVYYGDNAPLFRVDMSEFQDAEASLRFVDRIVDSIEENPSTVALFDEIEKANPEVLNILLQVLDEGFVTSSTGRKAYFYDAIIIATTNLLSKDVTIDNTFTKDEFIKEVISKNLIKPELLNRFDDVVMFLPLNSQTSYIIAGKMLSRLASEVMATKGVTLQFSPELIQALSLKSLESEFGAREIDRFIQNTIENWLARYFIENEVNPSEVVIIPVEALN